jgi:uncharacterized membrane protein
MRAFSEIEQVKQQRGLVLFFSMLAWCVGLIYFRVEHTGSDYFLFLIWNLFLACIPVFASRLLRLAHQRRVPDVAQLALLAVWLLFLPNAPYIVTDLIHLQPGSTRLYWYDLTMLLSCAGVGLVLGYSSLIDVHKIFEERFGHRVAWSVAAATLLLSGYGIYLGRAMRWNSWDVIANPRGLFDYIADCLLNPTAYGHTYAISGIFGAGLLFGYVTLHLMTSNRRSLAKD